MASLIDGLFLDRNLARTLLGKVDAGATFYFTFPEGPAGAVA